MQTLSTPQEPAACLLGATAQQVLARLCDAHQWRRVPYSPWRLLRDYDTFRGPAPAQINFVLDSVNGLIYSNSEFISAGENALASPRGSIFRAGQQGALLEGLVDEFAKNMDKAVSQAFSVRMMRT